ncbi:MAG: histidine triad nucleotide-binding protein [Chloroflexi bacterium]|jgi:histidine triad (HIT) family protein|nr:histidine triad nucleotide-binding protein [Chloroflexota bacterium]
MSSSCIFCRIIQGEAPAQMVYQDELVSAFRDIRPVAPVHVLVVPNKHIAALSEVTEEDQAILGRMLLVARRVAEQEGIAQSGFRLIVNNGPDANQIVYHLHLHVIGGHRLRFPMG